MGIPGSENMILAVSLCVLSNLEEHWIAVSVSIIAPMLPPVPGVDSTSADRIPHSMEPTRCPH